MVRSGPGHKPWRSDALDLLSGSADHAGVARDNQGGRRPAEGEQDPAGCGATELRSERRTPSSAFPHQPVGLAQHPVEQRRIVEHHQGRGLQQPRDRRVVV